MSRVSPVSRTSRVVLVAALVAATFVLAPRSQAAVTDVTQIWARDLPGTTIRESSPVLVDLNADGFLEIAFGAHDKKVWALHGASGQPVAGWPQGTTDKIDSSPSAADVDGDGRLELFVGAGTSEAESGALYSFEHNGVHRFRLDAKDKAFPSPAVHSTPAIGDTDGTFDLNVSFGTLGLLSVWSVSSKGNVRKGCPVDAEYPDGACWPFYADDTTYSSPALADADADGVDEVIIGSDSSAGAPVDHNGGFMRAIKSDRTTVWQVEVGDTIRSSPSVGNIDADEGLEVVFGAGDFYGNADSIKLFAVNLEDGSAVTGWPVETSGVTNASPTLADLDGDGVLDVAIGTFNSAHGKGAGGKVHAYTGDGTAIDGFPVDSGGGPVLGQIVTADVDDDGGQDLIVTTGALINVFDGSSGASLFKLAEGANVGFQNSAAVADVDADGRLDLLAAGTINTAAGNGRVYRWELGPEAVLGTNGWHEFRRDQHKTGSWSSGLGPTTALAHSRVAGADRYETAAKASQERTGNDGVDTVYVATGETFADALAGGPAAGTALTTPLLVTRDEVPAVTEAEIERLNPTNIVVIGGTSAINDTVLQELNGMAEDGAARVAGENRYATAAAVSAQTFDPFVPVVYLANGESYPDALSGAAAGAFAGGPVLLVTKDAVPEETDGELSRLLPRSIVILGGTGVVSAEVQAAVAGKTLPGQVSRLAGEDRYGTSAAVSADTFAGGAERAYLATGTNFPDALAGGPVAAGDDAPLLLVPGTCVPSSIRAEIQRLGATRLILLGGSGVTSPTLASMQPC